MSIQDVISVTPCQRYISVTVIIILFIYVHWSNRNGQTDYSFGAKTVMAPAPTGYSNIDNNSTTMKTILFWTKFYRSNNFAFGEGSDPFEKWLCSVRDCRTTTDRAEFSRADAVVFSLFSKIMSNKNFKLPVRVRSDQIYVMVLFESPIRIFYDIGKFRDQFNLTFTYLDDADTDIYAPSGTILPSVSGQNHYRGQMMQNKTKMVAWVVSNCKAPSQRMNYAKELMKYVGVDVYGKCGNHSCSRDNECFTSIARNYKFYLAFENSYCDGYVTEKMYRSLGLDIVPITLGGADYRRLFPEHSYIDVSDFTSPRALAQYLKALDQNNQQYLNYFQWKNMYNLVQRTRMSGFCKLCEILHNTSYRYKSGFDPSRYWNWRRLCFRGTAERKAIHLEV